jgi:preprotein translocase subunit SecB
MTDLRQKLVNETKVIKHYIKDLSFENLRDINNQNFEKDELQFSDNISAIFQTYDNNNFSVILKYVYDSTLIKNKMKCFVLEIEYFGLFKINEKEKYTQDELTKSGCTLLYPILKAFVEDIMQKGSPFRVSLKDLDFSQIKKN